MEWYLCGFASCSSDKLWWGQVWPASNNSLDALALLEMLSAKTKLTCRYFSDMTFIGTCQEGH